MIGRYMYDICSIIIMLLYEIHVCIVNWYFNSTLKLIILYIYIYIIVYIFNIIMHLSTLYFGQSEDYNDNMLL